MRGFKGVEVSFISSSGEAFGVCFGTIENF